MALQPRWRDILEKPQGFANENLHMIIDEAASDPTVDDLTEDGAVAMYRKNDKLVFAHNNGGTMTFVSIPLDGSTTTWTHSTSAP